MEKEIIRHYSNGEVTVKWQPGKCTHSTLCFRGLPGVFDPAKRPWVDAGGASTEEIIEQVKKCPSGALSYTLNRPEKQEPTVNPAVRIDIMPGGPMIFRGECNIRYADGSEGIINNISSFCRCGQSGNKPFCDGTHHTVAFEG
ncbi:MAG: (4Fe-4S)-binding protein [Bacteroidota bacterium]